LTYLTLILDNALHKVEDELREMKKFLSVEYEIILLILTELITANNEKIIKLETKLLSSLTMIGHYPEDHNTLQE